MHKVVYLLTVFVFTGSLFAADPFAGSWKLNIAKSKFEGPTKPRKELTLVVQEHGDQRVKGIAADGSPVSRKYTVAETGGEVRVLEGAPAGVSGLLATRKPDVRTADFTI